jgi:hypothetical protein
MVLQSSGFCESNATPSFFVRFGRGRSRRPADQPRAQRVACEFSWVPGTLLISSLVGRDSLQRFHVTRHVSAFAILACRMVEWRGILTSPCFGNRCYTSHGLRVDMGSAIHKKRELVGDNNGPRHVEQPSVSWQLVGIIDIGTLPSDFFANFISFLSADIKIA